MVSIGLVLYEGWQNLSRALESLKNFHFNRLLLSKVYHVWAKKVHWNSLSWNWRGIQNLERNRLVLSNWHRKFYIFLPEHSEVSNMFILMGSFWEKYILFALKKYRGVFFRETEEGYKICKGIDLSLKKWHKKFDKFWSEH